MAVTLANLLSDTTEKTRNSTTGALDNTKRTRAINRTLEDLQDYADWEFTRRTNDFDFIDGVNEYSLLNYVGTTCQDNDGTTSISDFKNPYDLRVADTSHNSFSYAEAKEVRYKIQQGRIVNEYGVEGDLLIINYPEQTSAQLNNCDSLTANGTWTASSDATNLTVDSVEYKEASASLNFDVSAGTSLVLSNSTLSSKDLTELQNKSHVIMWVYLPTITNFSSIAVIWGSDLSSNYWSKTETTRADGNAVAVGWNRFAFKWADSTQTGSPTVSAVDSIRVTITYSSSTTDTDFRIDDIRVGKSVPMKLDYYSLAMVQDAAGDYQLEFNPDSVTQTDTLLGGIVSRRTVVEGATNELFDIIGGKSERDRTDTSKRYEGKKLELLKKAGHRIRRPSRVLSFPGRHR